MPNPEPSDVFLMFPTGDLHEYGVFSSTGGEEKIIVTPQQWCQWMFNAKQIRVIIDFVNDDTTDHNTFGHQEFHATDYLTRGYYDKAPIYATNDLSVRLSLLMAGAKKEFTDAFPLASISYEAEIFDLSSPQLLKFDPPILFGRDVDGVFQQVAVGSMTETRSGYTSTYSYNWSVDVANLLGFLYKNDEFAFTRRLAETEPHATHTRTMEFTSDYSSVTITHDIAWDSASPYGTRTESTTITLQIASTYF